MAVYRPTPTCPYCGKIIAKGVYKNQSKIPSMLRVIGDTFIRWDYIEHTCEGKKKADKEMEDFIDKQISDMKKKGTLPPFFKQ